MAVLENELNYCTCSSSWALNWLKEILQRTQDRTDFVHDKEKCAQASDALVKLLEPHGSEWFIYFLEKENFLTHGFRVTDLWITDKGRELLDAMKRFPKPEETEDEEVSGPAP